ncbi:MAG: hypothetical protein D4S01_09385, partial [Dehalococcoidia bacterium]
VQWRLSAKSGADVWSHTPLFGEVEADTDYLVILSYETDSVDAESEVWVTKLSEPDLLEEASPSATLTVANDAFGELFFIGAADYPLGNVSALSAFFDEITLTESFPAVFGAWGNEEVFVEEPSVLSPEHVTSWHWIDDTAVNSVVEADVDGDGTVEIVTAGYFDDGVRDVAQLVVWDGVTLAVENIRTCYWTGDTRINSVAVADVDDDTALEIITAGYYDDGARDVAQLVVWDGETLAVENIKTWYWTGDTRINSVAVADVDGDGAEEIVTGGYYTDDNKIAQLVVWNGTSMAVENLVAWYWTADTQINSVAIGNVDMDSGVEIVTAGYFNDGTRDSAQLVAWDGGTLAFENVKTWYWTGDTRINSVAVGDVDGDGADEIVTGGYYTDGVKMAQLVVWNGTSMAVENLVAGYWTSETVINSVALGNVDMDAGVEIVTGGYFNDGVRDVAQLVVWDGSTLEVEPLTVWYWTGDTRINSVAIGNVDPDISEEILTAGYYDDSVNVNAQLVVWTITSN